MTSTAPSSSSRGRWGSSRPLPSPTTRWVTPARKGASTTGLFPSSRQPSIWPALVYLGLGDLDGLFQELERAFQERDGSLVLITSAIEFDPVRRDPRFE